MNMLTWCDNHLYSLLSSEKFLDGLLDLWAGLVERQSGALVVAGILDYLTFALCAPLPRHLGFLAPPPCAAPLAPLVSRPSASSSASF